MAKIMTVIGADFSANAMSLPQVVDIFNASYLQPNGYYDINITIGVTKYTDVKTSVGVYKSTLVPIESGYNYTLQS